jgi:hypothetical protein
LVAVVEVVVVVVVAAAAAAAVVVVVVVVVVVAVVRLQRSVVALAPVVCLRTVLLAHDGREAGARLTQPTHSTSQRTTRC